MTTPRRPFWLLLLAPLGLAACGDGRAAGSADADEPLPAAVRAARRAAERGACISTELSAKATSDLAMLDTMAVLGPVRAYALAFQQHATLRATAFAYLDSAANYADNPADSARYAQTAERFVISAPGPGTLEANILAEYERRFATLRADLQHPCNWES